MSKRFEWVPDVTSAEWLRGMEAEPFGSVLAIVPRGFEAYARVFHPVVRDRPRDINTWLGIDESGDFGVTDIAAALESETVTWAMAAASFDTTMHAEAQYARVVRCASGDIGGGVIAPDGWRYEAAPEGSLDARSLAAVSGVLAQHTGTPDAGIAAIWDGWGDLLSSSGAASFAFATSEGFINDSADEARIRAHNNKTGSNLLSSEVATGPRLDLHGNTGRHYILFEGGASVFADPAWPEAAPWVDNVSWTQSPSILWPDDHSWVLATEIDFDSTLIAGTTALIYQLLETSGIEVHPLRPDADLSWGGDQVNLRA